MNTPTKTDEDTSFAEQGQSPDSLSPPLNSEMVESAIEQGGMDNGFKHFVCPQTVLSPRQGIEVSTQKANGIPLNGCLKLEQIEAIADGFVLVSGEFSPEAFIQGRVPCVVHSRASDDSSDILNTNLLLQHFNIHILQEAQTVHVADYAFTEEGSILTATVQIDGKAYKDVPLVGFTSPNHFKKGIADQLKEDAQLHSVWKEASSQELSGFFAGYWQNVPQATSNSGQFFARGGNMEDAVELSLVKPGDSSFKRGEIEVFDMSNYKLRNPQNNFQYPCLLTCSRFGGNPGNTGYGFEGFGIESPNDLQFKLLYRNLAFITNPNGEYVLLDTSLGRVYATNSKTVKVSFFRLGNHNYCSSNNDFENTLKIVENNQHIHLWIPNAGMVRYSKQAREYKFVPFHPPIQTDSAGEMLSSKDQSPEEPPQLTHNPQKKVDFYRKVVQKGGEGEKVVLIANPWEGVPCELDTEKGAYTISDHNESWAKIVTPTVDQNGNPEIAVHTISGRESLFKSQIADEIAKAAQEDEPEEVIAYLEGLGSLFPAEEQLFKNCISLVASRNQQYEASIPEAEVPEAETIEPSTRPIIEENQHTRNTVLEALHDQFERDALVQDILSQLEGMREEELRKIKQHIERIKGEE